MGAHEIDLDTEAGWVRFALFDPEPIDFGRIADVLESANYELHTIEVEMDGTANGRLFVLDRSGQQLALARELPAARGRLRARIEVTAGGDTTIRVLSFDGS